MKKTIHTLDDWLARLCLPLANEQGLLLSFLIHAIFENEAEAMSGMLDPQQSLTVEMLRRLVEYFMRIGYKFISPEHLSAGLSEREKYVLLTFDDGYYNNVRALSVLEEFGIPAVFFISSGHVELGKAFWWDVIYRELRKRGRTNGEIERSGVRFKQLRTSEVESELRQEFGESALRPTSDLDRPFAPAELRDFASHRLVFIGNHTRDHAILTNYSKTEINEQICRGQKDIHQMTGKIPQIIAYPNGNYSLEILETARAAGLSFGMLTHAGQNRLLAEAGAVEAMALKRFTLWGNRSVDGQCRSSRSRVSLSRLLNTRNGKNTRWSNIPETSGKDDVFEDSAGPQQI